MRRLGWFLVLCLLAVGVPLVATAQTGELPGNCVIDEGTDVQVLLLVDQSGSLARTDPENRRIAGAEAVVRSYASLADRVGQVEIQVAGFGEDYAAGEWSALDRDTLGSVLERVATVTAVNDQDHTDYVYALDGAAEAFSGSTADCQILFWFTDGEHDLDADLLPAAGLERFYFPDRPVTPADVEAAETMMPGLVCDPGGYAERLGEAPQVPGRMELLTESPCVVLRDYAHTPDALERALSTLRPLTVYRTSRWSSGACL